MNRDTLKEIVAAEQEARRRVRSAREEAERIKQESRAKAEEILRRAHQEVEKLRETFLREAEEVMRKDRQKILEQARAEAEVAEKRYTEKGEDAIRAVIREIVGHDAGDHVGSKLSPQQPLES